PDARPIFLCYSYRCGLKWGLGAAFVNSALQLLLGASALRGLSVGTLLGSIFLDYILAFTVLGLGGMFRGKIKNDAVAFTVGSFIAMTLRYLCSFLHSSILWADSVNDAPSLQVVIGSYVLASAH